MVVRVYNDIIRDGHVTRGSIGVSWPPAQKQETLRAFGLDHGVILSDVKKGGPADKAGIKSDDIVVGINGKPVKDGNDLMARVADMPVGTAATIQVDRDGKKMDFKLVVQDRMQVFADDPRVVGENNVRPTNDSGKEVSHLVQFGIYPRALSNDERDTVPEKRGIYVTRVEPDSFAAEIGMQDRDIITSINRQQVNSVDDVKKVQSQLKPGDPVAFRVVRPVITRGTRSATPQPATLLLSGTLPGN
jgi:serine protease Do